MSKKILMISQHFYPEIGSAANRMKNFYQLMEKGNEVTLLTIEPSYPNKNFFENEKFWDETNLNNDQNIIRVRLRDINYSKSKFHRLFFYIYMMVKMITFILFTKSKYDVVLATSPPIFIGIVGLMAKFKFRSTFILDIRDLWPESLKGVGVFNNSFIIWPFKKVEQILYRASDRIIVNSKGFITYIEDECRISKDKIMYIPNGAREDELIKKRTSEYTKDKVIYAGNIGLAQDVDVLMGIAEILHSYNIRLDIIGYGAKRESFIQYIKEKGLSNVTFFEPKSRRECFELLRGYPIGIATLNTQKVFETVLPGKILDYMTCGVPIVASVSGYAKSIIEQARVGVVTEKRTSEELAKLIIALLNDDNRLHDYSENGFKKVEEEYLWEENIHTLKQELYELYNTLKGRD